MFDIQQDVFQWMRKVDATETLAAALAIEAPSFAKVMEALTSSRYEGSLPAIPVSWDQHLKPEVPLNVQVPKPKANKPSGSNGTSTVFYGRA